MANWYDEEQPNTPVGKDTYYDEARGVLRGDPRMGTPTDPYIGQEKVQRGLEQGNLGEYGARLGFGTQDAEKRAQQELEYGASQWDNLGLPSFNKLDPYYGSYEDIGPSELGGIELNPAYREAQQEQLGALRNLANRGGRDAAGDANLAGIQARENANARGQREAILQNAAARGAGGSGASILAQLSSSQNATNNQSLQDLGVRAQDQNNAMQARMGAANVGANMEGADYDRAASRANANDSIKRFNAGNRAQMSQFNAGIGNNAQTYNNNLDQQGFDNALSRTKGRSDSSGRAVDYYSGRANERSKQSGEMLGGLTKIGTTVASAFLSEGGKIPGQADVPGDSIENDDVPIMASPGEVVVPRTLAMHGSNDAIASFVKDPPEAEDPEREYKLAALQHLFGRGAS